MMAPFRRHLFILLWLSFASSDAGPPQPHVVGHPVVELPDCRLRVDRLQLGDTTGQTFLRARGVQYAEHPVGELRWQPPVPSRCTSDDIVEATAFGKDCVNAPWISRLGAIRLDAMGEECLFLNVWAPEAPSRPPSGSSGGRPVMLWIHGGAFNVGGSSQFNGDSVMALGPDIVLVTVNYRLNGLGFLAGSAVRRSSRDGSAGNFAVQDTREAMRWVQRNIAAFGGDPGRVTIFGESAGASMVACHLVMPRSAGLFSGAIMESGPFDNFTVQEPGTEDDSFHDFAQQAGCGNQSNDDAMLACLRRKPLRSFFEKDLMGALAFTGTGGYFGPVVDGVELSDVPEVLAAKGQINEVEGVMLGTNRNEGRLMMLFDDVMPGAPYSTEAQFLEWLYQVSGNNSRLSREAFSLYHDVGSKLGWWKAATALYTDMQYTCPTARSARWLQNSGKVPSDSIYVYELRYVPEAYRQLIEVEYWYHWCLSQGKILCPERHTDSGVGHGADVVILWPKVLPQNATDSKMVSMMWEWWHTFAQDRRPVAKQSPAQWAPFAHKNDTLFLSLEPRLVSANRLQACRFWDRQHPVPYDRAQAMDGASVFV